MSLSGTDERTARDGGCRFPGCDRPPELCERHHIVPCAEGGQTDLDDLTLLCLHHHRQFADHGWTVALDADGLPAWTPPRWVDREQRPLIRSRILLARLRRQQAADLLAPPLFPGRVLVPRLSEGGFPRRPVRGGSVPGLSGSW